MPTKKCNGFIREGVTKKPCGTSYSYTTGSSSLCPNRDRHILRMRTGFCQNGWCEGTKAKSSSGGPAPTCTFYLTCPCNCHDMVSKMFEMSGMKRILVDKSEYHPERTWWMPSDEPMAPLSIGAQVVAPTLVESPAPDIVPPSLRRPYAPTATGRAARGELESWVKDACDVWLIDQEQFPCTPAWIADEISKTQAITPPSVGAISAVFDRWSNLGFAKIEKKPTRFVYYSAEGITLGLEKMKDRAKRSKRLQHNDQKRNLIR